MKILWIGKYLSDEKFLEMVLKGYRDPAAQQSQNNLISAIDEIGIPLDTLNAYNVPSTYKDRYIDGQTWSRTGKSKDVSVGYRNIKYFSHVIRMHKLILAAKEWVKGNCDDTNINILVYGMQSSLLASAIEVKKLVQNSRIYLIAPDLPQYMDMDMSRTKNFLKRIDWKIIQRQLRFVDGYIFYTKQMASFLNIPDDKWVLMEGSISVNDITENPSVRSQDSIISVMYSGKIDKRYGVLELLDAIKHIQSPYYEFWFTGDGNAVPVVQERAQLDKRIKYLGFFPTRAMILRKQQEATMLMNMRLPTEEGSAYCFPSKLFEYMVSGKPVLSFRLLGIPNEYYDYLITINSPSAHDIAEAIQAVGNMPVSTRTNIGMRARHFITNKKNASYQAKRIIDFIIQ